MLGDGLATSVAHELEVEPVIGDGRALVKLGAAHGWAGWLYALLRWHVATGTAAAGSVGPAALRRRLDELAAFGQVHGRGMYWPLQTAAPVVRGPLAASWCNGAAGYVPLWSLAHRAFGTTFMPG